MLLQFLVNGLIAGVMIAIMAIGFWFIYRATNLFHIAHGAIYTVAAYIFYSLFNSHGVSIPVAMIGAFSGSILLGLAMYFIVYKPLEKKNASAGIKFISSLSVYIIIINVIALLYGNETKVLSEGVSASINIGLILITEIQIYQFCSFLFIFLFSYLFVKWTKAGRAIRAIGDNPVLFKAIGLSEKWVKVMVFSIGSAIAALASILSGLDVGIDPHMGMLIFLNAIVAVIIGGVKKLEGVVIGSIIIGVIQNIVIWQFSARWDSAVTFLALVIILLYKSGGLFVIRRRVEEL